MEINIQVIDFKESEVLRSYCMEGIQNSPLMDYTFISTINVLLRVIKENPTLCKASIEVRQKKGKEIFAESSDKVARKAFNDALDKIKRSVRKYKEKHYDSSHIEYKP